MDKKFNKSMLFIHYKNKNKNKLIFFNSIYLNIFLYVLY